MQNNTQIVLINLSLKKYRKAGLKSTKAVLKNNAKNSFKNSVKNSVQNSVRIVFKIMMLKILLQIMVLKNSNLFC